MRRFGAAVFGLLLLVPLAASASGYDVLRMPLALGLVTLLLARQALGAIRRPERESRGDPLLVAALLLTGVHVLSLAVARSLWEAAHPLLLLSAGVAAYAFARDGGLTRAWVLGQGIWIVAGMGLVFGLVGIVQAALGIPAVSTEGNTNYSGAVAAILLPASFASAWVRAAAWKRAMAGAASASLLALLVLAHSRGAMIGAAAGGMVAAGALVAKRLSRAKFAAAALALALLAGFALGAGTHFSTGRRVSAGVRLEIWKAGAWMLRANPWIGVGVGQFAVEYPRFRSAEEYRLSHSFPGGGYREVEDAHSLWVQIAVETGVPGVLALLLLVYVAARLWRHHVKSAPDGETAAVLAGLGGGAAAFLGAGCFNTLTLHVSPVILFWTFLGMMRVAGDVRERVRRRPAREWDLAVPVALTAAGAFATWVAATISAAEMAHARAMVSEKPVEDLKEAVAIHRPHWRAHYHLGVAYDGLGSHREAAVAYRDALAFRPFHAAAMNNLALARLRVPEGMEEAERILRAAAETVRWYPSVHYNLGLLEAGRGRFAEARGHLERALELDGTHAPAQYALGEVHFRSGEPEAAVRRWRRARELGKDVGATLRAEHPSLLGDPRFAEFYR